MAILMVQKVEKMDLCTVVLDVVIFHNNVSVRVNAVIYYRVVNPKKAIIQTEDFNAATSQLAQNPQALQLRYLQTLSDISGDKTNTIVFPFSGDFSKLFTPQKS